MNGAAVDLVFTKKTSKSGGVGKATLRATQCVPLAQFFLFPWSAVAVGVVCFVCLTRCFPSTSEELRSYADTGRRGAMSVEAFHSAVRAVSRHMYPPPADSFATFFEKHIVPVALDEGDKLLAMSDRRLVKGYSASMTILQEVGW